MINKNCKKITETVTKINFTYVLVIVLQTVTDINILTKNESLDLEIQNKTLLDHI